MQKLFLFCQSLDPKLIQAALGDRGWEGFFLLLLNVTVLFCFSLWNIAWPGWTETFFTLQLWNLGIKPPLCDLHYFLTNIVHCHIAEVNLINIGTFNFYVQSKELFHAHFEYSKEMIARKIMFLWTIQSN